MILREFKNLERNNLPRKIFHNLSVFDKWIILFLLVIVIVDLGIISFQQWIRVTQEVPLKGGVYIEGIIASSLADIKPTLDELTKIGFVDYNQNQELIPAAAKSWAISADNKTYTFVMKEEISKQIIEESLGKNQNIFPNVDIEVTDEKQVIFRLKQPFSPFLATTANPIFPIGPYEIEKEDKGIVKLKSRSSSITDEPFIQEIIIKVYPDSFNLTQALAVGEIQGVADSSRIENPRLLEKLSNWELELPRKIFLFFNTEREIFKNTTVRQKIKDHKKLDQLIEINLVTLINPHNEALAQKLATDWEALNIKTTITSYTSSELASDIIPNRAYDALIYGLDFGGDPDPYPFWHSSQIGKNGLNLAQFANIDTDRILEKARQSNNQEERARLYSEFNKILDREMPAIELEKIIWKFATDYNLKGIKSGFGLTSADRYQDIERWYRRTKREKK